MAGRVIAVVCVLSSILIYSCSDSSDSPRVAALDAPPSDCLWTVEVTPGVDEADNVLHPDLNAGYWTALFAIPSDALCITLEGAFPHARNMSFNSAARGGRSISYIFDKDIVPELGSTNPFVPGNARNDPNRIYSIRVKSPGDEAVCPAPINEQNVISADVGFARIMYRIYANDASANLMGGVGLPRVTLYMADGSVLQGEDACEVISPIESGSIQVGRAGVYTPAEYAELRGSADPSSDPPVFRNTFSIRYFIQCDFGGNCGPPINEIGVLGAPDSRLLYAFASRTHGEILVLRAKLPMTPETSQGQDVAIEGEMRYWSICSYELYAERAEDCLIDEQVQVNEDAYYTIVYSREEDRPDNASADCGVSYLRWSENGDGFGIEEGYENHANDGQVVIRNILPSTDFPYAIPPLDAFGEEEKMGDYLPKGKYFTKAEFEALGCNPWLSIPYSEM